MKTVITTIRTTEFHPKTTGTSLEQIKLSSDEILKLKTLAKENVNVIKALSPFSSPVPTQSRCVRLSRSLLTPWRPGRWITENMEDRREDHHHHK